MAEARTYTEEPDEPPSPPGPGSPEADSTKKYEFQVWHKGKVAYSIYTDHFVEFTDQAIDLTTRPQDPDKSSS